MDAVVTLEDHLGQHACVSDRNEAVAVTVGRLADAAWQISDIIALGPLGGVVGATLGRNADGDLQKDLDLTAHAILRAALGRAPVARFASEEAETIETLDEAAPLSVAIDPVDGSGNIAVNMPIGTIFSVVPSEPARAEAIWPSGRRQHAAGFFVYGPQTALMLSLGDGVDTFTLDRRRRVFVMTARGLTIPAEGPDEYAVNASNYRHWEEPIRSFVDDCVAGADGRLGRNFNMRWHGALVAEAFRILTRGGLFLYPADQRRGYGSGRLRLVYEAYPIAFLMEQAGGAATTGRMPILDMPADRLHMRVPLILGSATRVQTIEAMHHRTALWPETPPPLFSARSLFRM